MGWFTKAKKLEDMTEKELLVRMSQQLNGIIVYLALIFGFFVAYMFGSI